MNFAKYGSVQVFLGIRPNRKTEKLEAEIRQFSRARQFKIRFQTAT
jgi:hypothetical protein